MTAKVFSFGWGKKRARADYGRFWASFILAELTVIVKSIPQAFAPVKRKIAEFM
jgi:hypothetical protein